MVFLLVGLLLTFSPDSTPPVVTLSGVVVDASGAPVAGATVRLAFDSRPVRESETDAAGRFSFAGVLPGAGHVSVFRAGFAEVVHPLALDGVEPTRSLQLVLRPAVLTEALTVTASRRELRGLETPASVTVLTSADLWSAAALTLDDALRVVPGFSLFRRSSSRVANPTTHGVTLRGLSASGASRAVVLADGLPLNDPFGGWVAWSRIPQAAIERVEVVRGGLGELYGPDAIGGVVQILTIDPGRPRARVTMEGGSLGTGRASAFGGGRTGPLSAIGAAEWFRTTGYRLVSPGERGPIDIEAGSEFRSALAGLGYRGAGGGRADIRLNLLDEDRRNGTPLQTNDTIFRQLAAEMGGTVGGGVWTGRAFVADQTYRQVFSAIVSDRDAESLTQQQRVPSDMAGVMLQMVLPWRSGTFLFGAEGKRVWGVTDELRFAGGQPIGEFRAGGVQRNGAVFGQVTAPIRPTVTAVVGLRGDAWESRPEDAAAGRRLRGFVSPRAAVTWRAHSLFAVQGAAFVAHRTPTLNELHRGFRVGNTSTTPNPGLAPEQLRGGEAGVLFTRGRLSGRATGFWNHVEDPITNVTLSASPTLIVRQRQNAGALRSAGLEIEADVRLTSALALSGSGVLTRARFHETADPQLRGNRVPQVPTSQWSTALRYAAPDRMTVSAQLRVIGQQFDDDLNRLALRRAAVIDVLAGRTLAPHVHAFAAIENVFDAEYDVGRTPVRTVGLPRTLRGGVRIFLP
jgi:outer membrane receptor protein involved in Fe transport